MVGLTLHDPAFVALTSEFVIETLPPFDFNGHVIFDVNGKYPWDVNLTNDNLTSGTASVVDYINQGNYTFASAQSCSNLVDLDLNGNTYNTLQIYNNYGLNNLNLNGVYGINAIDSNILRCDKTNITELTTSWENSGFKSINTSGSNVNVVKLFGYNSNITSSDVIRVESLKVFNYNDNNNTETTLTYFNCSEWLNIENIDLGNSVNLETLIFGNSNSASLKTFTINLDVANTSLTTITELSCLTSIKVLVLSSLNNVDNINDIESLTSITYLIVSHNNMVTSFDCANLTQLNELYFFNCPNLTNFIIDNPLLTYASLPHNSSLSYMTINDVSQLSVILLDNCSLNQTSVDSILLALDNNGLENGTCYLNGGTNASPTGGTSNTNYINLINKGWSVLIN